MRSINNDYDSFSLTLEDRVTYQGCTLSEGFAKIPRFTDQGSINIDNPNAIGCNLDYLALGLGGGLGLAALFFSGIYYLCTRKTSSPSVKDESTPLNPRDQISTAQLRHLSLLKSSNKNDVEMDKMSKSGEEQKKTTSGTYMN